MKSKYLNEAEIARAKRDFDVKKAMYDAEVFSAKAEADLASKIGVQKYYGLKRSIFISFRFQ